MVNAAVVVAMNCLRVGVSFDSMFSLFLSVGWLSDDHQRPHHVVLLVLQDVAMPHVLVTAGAWARWHGERCRGEIEFHDDRCALAGVHPDGFLPATLVRVRWPRRAKKAQTPDIERLP